MTNNELVKGFGSLLMLTAVILGIIVTFLILQTIEAGTLLWTLYAVEVVLMFVGAIMKALGEGL